MRRPALSLLLVLLLVACGASQREKTIRATFDATNIAADSLVSFSRAREQTILDAATTKESAETHIKAFRIDVDRVERTIAATYRMTAAAAIANDNPSLAALLKVAEVLWAELKALGVKVPHP